MTVGFGIGPLERERAVKPSTRLARRVLFRLIENLRPQVVEALRNQSFPLYSALTPCPVVTDWALLATIKQAQALRDSLDAWSRKWNLNDDWCLDFAIRALRFWACNEREHALKSWWGVDAQLENDLIWSEETFTDEIQFMRGIYGEALYSKEKGEDSHEVPEPKFSFEYKGFSFEGRAWNPFLTKRLDYENEISEEFYSTLNSKTKARLSVPYGIKTKFSKCLKGYIVGIEKAAVGKQGLVPTPQKWAVGHFKWLIEFQIPPTRKYREIGREAGKDEKTIRGGVADAAALIRLSLRESDKPSGRPKGSKNKAGSRGRVRYST